MRWVCVLVVALSGCGTLGIPKPCRSTCGAALYGSSDCEGFSIIEEITLEILGYYSASLCNELKHVSVQVWATDDGSWTDNWGRKVAGLASCDTFTIELGTDNWADSAYAHELVHIADCPMTNSNHDGWQEMGIYDALAEIKKEAETRTECLPQPTDDEVFIESEE